MSVYGKFRDGPKADTRLCAEKRLSPGSQKGPTAEAADVVERLDALHRPVTRALAREAVEGAEASGALFE
jgi:hypothetical protein